MTRLGTEQVTPAQVQQSTADFQELKRPEGSAVMADLKARRAFRSPTWQAEARLTMKMKMKRSGKGRRKREEFIVGFGVN